MVPPQITLNRPAAESVRRGHPWVWRLGIARGDRDLAAGDEVALTDAGGSEVARGVYDPASPIAVRVWSHGEPVDEALFTSRVERALAVRGRLFEDGTTTAYRVLNGEGDRVPGIVVDRYGHVAIVRADGAGAEAVIARFSTALAGALAKSGMTSIALRRSPKGEAPSFEVLQGPDPPATIHVSEHGVPFVVDLAKGQKTGSFLDQRENRRRVAALAKGRSTLNLFSYAGGFSLAAVRGGASRVTSVDISAPAHATAQASFKLAGFDPGRHEFVAADAFAYLDQAKKRGQRWDLVISDPPSFAPSEKALPRALSAYRGLHRACGDVLDRGGILCASSCSSHVDANAFAGTLDDNALGRADLRMLELYGQPADHPTVPAWPEGRYLKFAVLE